MNKKKSKVLAFLLATAMLVPSANGTIYAAKDLNANKEVSQVNKEVASIEGVREDKVDLYSQVRKASGNEASADGVEYTTLKEALEAGGEVKLLRDVEVNEIIEIIKDTTLNLGDFTITDNAAKRPFVVKTENFTIKANKGGMVIPESNTGSYGFVEAYVKNFKILGGNYSGNTDNGRLFRINATKDMKTGTLEVDRIIVHTNNQIIGTNGESFSTYNATIKNSEFYDGTRALYFDILDTTEASTVTIENTKAIMKQGPVVEMAGGNAVLSNNDWTVTGDYDGGYTWSRAAIGIGYGGVVTVKSGTYSAKTEHMKDDEGYGAYIYNSGGTLKIEGGSFKGTTASIRAHVHKDYNTEATIDVHGGEFEGDIITTNLSDKVEAKINIEGGNFKELTDKTTDETNKIKVTGGSFDKSVKDFVSDELKYELENKGKDEENNDVSLFTYHRTLQDATDNSSSNSNITPTKKPEPSKPDEPEKKSYTVKLNYNDGTGKVLTLNGYENEKITLPKPERDGEYNFLSWKDNNGNEYKVDTEITLTNNLEFTAQWEKIYVPSKPIHPTYDHTSIIGSDRYDTAAKIADKLGSYDTAVLVNATSTMSDGLSASGLAGKEKGAILLTKKDSIPKVTMDRLKKVKKVYIIGGENAISAKVANEITAAGIKIERIGGKTRVETSELVAKKLGNYKKAFVVNGFKGEADAMSASSVAAKNGAPILLTNGKTSTHAKKSGVKYYVVGGNNVVNKSIASKYNAEVLAGDDRYETNREVINEFYGESETLYFANGETLVDALTASTISKNDGLVLVGRKSDNKILNKKNTIQVGGMKFDVDFEK